MAHETKRLLGPFEADLSGSPSRKRVHPTASPPMPQDDKLQRPKKRSRDDFQGRNLTLNVIHHVTCRGKVVGHKRHSHSALFKDQPRLFEGDTKASSLRGQYPIASTLEDYLDEYPDDSLTILRTYGCIEYQALIRDKFIRLPISQADFDTAAELRPYFYKLDCPVAPAVASRESIHITHAFRETMNRIEELEPTLFAQWEKSLSPPYLQFYYAREKLRDFFSEGQNIPDAEHVSLLLSYVENTFGPQYQAAHLLFDQGLVTIEHFDKLFRPNDTIVAAEEGEPVAYTFSQCPVFINSPTQKYANLNCYKWLFDGLFRKERRGMKVNWPIKGDGAIPISALEFYPLKYDPTGRLEKTLRDRGSVFWSCRQRNLLGYEAPTGAFRINVSSPRYMVDVATYHDLHNKEQEQGQEQEKEQEQEQAQVLDPEDYLDEDLLRSNEPPEGPFLLLLPPRIRGFGLHDKKWRTLLVKHLIPVNWNKKAFEQLVLDPQKKELIEATVRVHTSSSISTDVIEGKGNGLIILLHGGPGTGKTLTAESVAELAEKPLYRVTCGDIGIDAEGVERYLESVLYIGHIWKAVLLLDESDVFLEEREKTDLQRNALVSVFLRALEYYEGILILTSNRVGIFDEAFKSRVQLALHFPPLNYKGRWEIWSNLINLLRQQQENKSSHLVEGESINTDELRDKIDVLAKENLNGRQIRNAVTTARQLACFRKKPLGYSHLSQTIRIANEFEEYVEKTHGHKAGEYAKAAGMRLE